MVQRNTEAEEGIKWLTAKANMESLAKNSEANLEVLFSLLEQSEGEIADLLLQRKKYGDIEQNSELDKSIADIYKQFLQQIQDLGDKEGAFKVLEQWREKLQTLFPLTPEEWEIY